VIAELVTWGLATPIFGLIGPVKRVRRVASSSMPLARYPVGVQR
jgi:hypothetical protein